MNLVPFASFPAISIASLANLALSSVIGGLVIWVIMKLVGEPPDYFHSLTIAFLANFMNIAVYLVLSIPFFHLGFLAAYLPIIIWILAAKLFYGTRWGHAIIIGFLGWLSFIFIVPQLVYMAKAYIPV